MTRASRASGTFFRGSSVPSMSTYGAPWALSAGAARAWLPLCTTVTLSATSGSQPATSSRVKPDTAMMAADRRRTPGSTRAIRRTAGLTASG